jgi:hypothetical protein
MLCFRELRSQGAVSLASKESKSPSNNSLTYLTCMVPKSLLGELSFIRQCKYTSTEWHLPTFTQYSLPYFQNKSVRVFRGQTKDIISLTTKINITIIALIVTQILFQNLELHGQAAQCHPKTNCTRTSQSQ